MKIVAADADAGRVFDGVGLSAGERSEIRCECRAGKHQLLRLVDGHIDGRTGRRDDAERRNGQEKELCAHERPQK